MKTFLIVTGIYPPQIGGPALYAKSIEDVWKRQGYRVLVSTFILERFMPTGVRHVYFFLRNFFKFIRADYILVLDTWSVAMPTAIACLILRKSFVIRTGGDFLWESYVERTKKKILFREFYDTEINNFNFKEKFIFKTTKWILSRASWIVFSTTWQRDVWLIPFKLDIQKVSIVENFYDKDEFVNNRSNIKSKVFIGSVRNLAWKNLDNLKRAFAQSNVEKDGFSLDLNQYQHNVFVDHIKNAHAVILVSLGDISPHLILEAISHNVPFICTKECGLYDRIGHIGLWVDPLDENGISDALKLLTSDEEYQKQKKLLNEFMFKHSFTDIANELKIILEKNKK